MLVFIKVMAQQTRRGSGLVLGSLLSMACGLSVACGDGDDLEPGAGLGSPVMIAPPEVQPEPAPEDDPPPTSTPSPPSNGTGGGGADNDDDDDDDGAQRPPQPVANPDACTTPLGVSGTPSNLQEAIILMNSLPRPTSLACFLQALSRPLEVYMTSSGDSLQPSPGARSPRTFIVYEPLVMSIVFEGAAAAALELGYRTTPTRSIKTEITFPLTTDVTATNFFDEVEVGASTRCGACHTGEVQIFSPDFPSDVFESDIIQPLDFQEVDVESVRAENQNCDASLEPERCEMLSAFFDYGTVNTARQGILFGL